MVPQSFLNYANPLSGQIPAHDTLNLDNEFYVPSGAPAGWYTLIGRIGSYPNTAIDAAGF